MPENEHAAHRIAAAGGGACSHPARGAGRGQVTVVGWPGGPEETGLRAVADIYNARKDVADEDKVELIFFSRDGFWEKLQADLAAGSDAFDVNLLATYSIGRYAPFMQPLDLGDTAAATFGPTVLTTMQFDGKQYGVPTDLSLHFLYYRKDLIDELLADPDAQARYTDRPGASRPGAAAQGPGRMDLGRLRGHRALLHAGGESRQPHPLRDGAADEEPALQHAATRGRSPGSASSTSGPTISCRRFPTWCARRGWRRACCGSRSRSRSSPHADWSSRIFRRSFPSSSSTSTLSPVCSIRRRARRDPPYEGDERRHQRPRNDRQADQHVPVGSHPPDADRRVEGDHPGLSRVHQSGRPLRRFAPGRLFDGPNASNTFIVLWSDHGFQLGEKLAWRKFTLWERALRVPMIFAGPGIAVANRTPAVSLIDLYPTLSDLAFGTVPGHLQGRSLKGNLQSGAGIDSYALSTWRESSGVANSGPHFSVRTATHRYVRYRSSEKKLYDHRVDRYEFDNRLFGGGSAADRQVAASLDALVPPAPYAPRRGGGGAAAAELDG